MFMILTVRPPGSAVQTPTERLDQMRRPGQNSPRVEAISGLHGMCISGAAVKAPPQVVGGERRLLAQQDSALGHDMLWARYCKHCLGADDQGNQCPIWCEHLRAAHLQL